MDEVTKRRVFFRVARTRKLYEGTQKHILNRGGVSHWLGMPPPLTNGNCVLFGHRTAAGGPLRNAHRLGDLITLTVGPDSLTYRVAEAPFVVDKDDFVSVAKWSDDTIPRITLVACSKANKKPTSTAYRLIVRAEANVPT